jgi:ectoine hydroxylase-related dioxygenase (phytanoyl-CoA dioxygenase family)
MLTRAQIDQYHDLGYLVVPDLVDAESLAAMRGVLRELLDGARKVTGHTDVYDLEPGHTPDEPRVRRIKQPFRVHPVYAQVARSPRIVAVLQQLLGPAGRLRESKINLKSPRYGSPVEWHQDWAFYPHTNDDVLAVGVMLEDASVENGAMLVVPGSHKGPTWNHHGPDGCFCGAIDLAECTLDFSRAVPLEGQAGACTFHHARLVHGSAQNRSGRPRAFLLYEVAAADAFPLMGPGNHEEFHARMVYGDDTNVPRFREAPVRMPLPPARRQGSLYEFQTGARRRYFERTDVPAVTERAVV